MAVINPHDPNKILDLEWTLSLARFRLEFAAAADTSISMLRQLPKMPSANKVALNGKLSIVYSSC
jgi:hypothetical protein